MPVPQGWCWNNLAACARMLLGSLALITRQSKPHESLLLDADADYADVSPTISYKGNRVSTFMFHMRMSVKH